MNYWESSFCVKISKIFEKSVSLKHLDLMSFIDRFEWSTVFSHLLDFDESIISQGELYIITLIIENYPDLENIINDSYKSFIAEWLGYLYGYMLILGINKQKIRNVDWKYLYENYDTLHTQSCRYVINYIDEWDIYKKGKMVFINNDFIRKVLKNYQCILAYHTAADYLNLSNGGYRDTLQVYVEERQNINENTDEIIVEELIIDSFSSKQYTMVDGLLCTTEEQTIIDLLYQNGDLQIIQESLGNYYFDHNESYDDLVPMVPDYLMKRFEIYSVWGKEYYNDYFD